MIAKPTMLEFGLERLDNLRFVNTESHHEEFMMTVGNSYYLDSLGVYPNIECNDPVVINLRTQKGIYTFEGVKLEMYKKEITLCMPPLSAYEPCTRFRVKLVRIIKKVDDNEAGEIQES